MHFDLEDEQVQFANSLDGLLADALPASELVKRVYRPGLHRDLWRKLAELGLFSIIAPETVEGLDLGLLTLSVAAERLGWHGAPGPAVENAFAAWALAGPRPDVAQRIMAGETVAALALGEAAGWRPEQWTLNGGNGVSGVKTNVAFAEDADFFLVGLKGGRLGLVEAKATGVAIDPVVAVDLTRPMGHVRFDEAPMEIVETDLDRTTRLVSGLLIALAADAAATGRHAVDMAVEYAKVREQFDRPIGAFQALKHQLANMAAQIEPTRYLCWFAAHQWDLAAPGAQRLASVTKAHVTDVAVATIRAAIEAHGGIGYTWEYPLHIFLKRAMTDRALLGLPSEHREIAAALAGW